jgi:hypothetical protein
MRWTRTALLTKAHACGRRSRVVLTPRRWRQVGGGDSTGDGDNKARSPGRARRKPLKPLRREGRVFRWTCGDALACLLFYTRGCGCSGHPAFPAPSDFGRMVLTQLGRITPRECGSVSRRHSGMREAQTSDVPLHIGESRDSGFDASHRSGMTVLDCFAEPVIGRAFARPVGSQ